MIDLSIVICSIKPEKAEETKNNILATSGVNCEFIIVDNRERKWPIAKAYNYGASQAKGEVIFFAHEDILFKNEGWAKPIIDKIKEPTTGVVGFVGSRIRTDCYSPWSQVGDYSVGHLYYIEDGLKQIIHNGVIYGQDFRQVIVVDGLGFLVSKKVWREYPFDEERLTGFHCYDIDFCLTIAQHYKNYVYTAAEIYHYSNGNMGIDWAKATVFMTDDKWRKMTPIVTPDVKDADLDKITARGDYHFLWKIIRDTKKFPTDFVKPVLKRYISRCGNPEYRSHLFTLLWQYMIKRM